jgi:hypothetical protein
MKNMFCIAALIATTLCTSAHAQSSVSQKPCELFTRNDAEALLNTPVLDPVQRTTSLPAGQSCRYSFKHKGDTFGVTIRVSTPADIFEEGVFQSAEDQMARQKKARQSGEATAKSYSPEFREFRNSGTYIRL